jgi:hypothetical protein
MVWVGEDVPAPRGSEESDAGDKWSGLGPELARKLGGFGAMVGAGRWRSGKARWIGFGT